MLIIVNVLFSVSFIFLSSFLFQCNAMAPETFSGKIYIVKIVLYKMMREGYI